MDVVKHRIRFGEIKDIPQIHRLAKELLDASAYGGTKMNDLKFKKTVANCISSKLGCCFVAVDADDVPAGFILGIVDTPFYSDERFATDLAFYVRPEARSMGAWLASRFVRWARSMSGVTDISMAISSGMGDVDRIGRMYERMGMKRVGGLYTMRIPARLQIASKVG